MGDMVDLRRMRSWFEEPPYALTTRKPMMPMHCYMVLALHPHTYVEVARNPFQEASMEEEYNSLLENTTWDLVFLPSSTKLFKWRSVYMTKNVAGRQVSRYKERLITNGFQQIHGIEYDATFALVANMDSI